MRRVSERPLRRSIAKLVISALGGKSWRHAQDWLPGLQLDIPQEKSRAGEIRYRGSMVSKLSHPAVLEKEIKSAVYIVGSGPSVKGCDLSGVEAGTCILLNGAINLIRDPISTPLAIAIEDERFVWRHFDLMREKITHGVICLFSTSVIRAICEIDGSWLGDRRIILINDIRKPYRLPRRSDADIADLDFVRLNEDRSAGISMAPERGVFQGGSVVISALQFAIYWRPAEIGFFGIDISNANDPRFYEKAGDMAKSGLVEGQKRILEHVTLAKAVCSELDIKLSNFSKISALRECGLGYDDRFSYGK
ncbi:glycosyl transferase [Rhizobium wenxiniae]|uniref:glycosyl transferase n=1 Tax=Rhizobium wenxiniae TaxID=1737357 RepID=UPI003C21803F